MATRADDLYPEATKMIHWLGKRVGNQKLLLSAGVIVLAKLTAEDREAACQEAMGETGLVMDLYSERKALERIWDKCSESRIVAHAAGNHDVEELSTSLLAMVESGLAMRFIPGKPLERTAEAQIAELKALVRDAPENVEAIVTEHVSKLVADIRHGLPLPSATQQEADEAVEGAEADAKDTRRTRGRGKHAAEG